MSQNDHDPRAAVSQNAAISELISAFDHILLLHKMHDDIANGSRVVVLKNKQTDRPRHPQTDTTENIPPAPAIHYQCTVAITFTFLAVICSGACVQSADRENQSNAHTLTHLTPRLSSLRLAIVVNMSAYDFIRQRSSSTNWHRTITQRTHWHLVVLVTQVTRDTIIMQCHLLTCYVGNTEKSDKALIDHGCKFSFPAN